MIRGAKVVGTWVVLAWSGWILRPAAGRDAIAPVPRGWVLLREVVFLQAHWAFYRAAPFILLEDAYAAAIFGVLLVGVEWIVVLIRNGLRPLPEERQVWLRRSALRS